MMFFTIHALWLENGQLGCFRLTRIDTKTVRPVGHLYNLHINNTLHELTYDRFVAPFLLYLRRRISIPFYALGGSLS